MEKATRAPGSSIKCMVQEPFNGLMAENTLGNILMTKNTDMGLSNGEMEENMRVIGQMANSMESASILMLKANNVKENGLKAFDYHGSMIDCK